MHPAAADLQDVRSQWHTNSEAAALVSPPCLILETGTLLVAPQWQAGASRQKSELGLALPVRFLLQGHLGQMCSCTVVCAIRELPLACARAADGQRLPSWRDAASGLPCTMQILIWASDTMH